MNNDYRRQIRETDKEHFLHPWTHFASFKTEGALPLSQGEGCYLTDIEGRKYFDAVGGLWCTNIGLGREEMAQAIAEQVTRLAFCSNFIDLTNEPAVLLAKKLAELAPGDLNHVFYTTGGSTALDSAFRMAQFHHCSQGKPEKRHAIARRNAYHGTTYLAASLGAKPGDRVPEFGYETETVHHISDPNPLLAPDGMDEAQLLDMLAQEFEDKILEVGPEKVGAFFAEPIMGAGGVIVPPKGYHVRFKEICEQHDILYIADEVVTAFGRLGHWFASEDVFGMVPDIICAAKGITSGYLPLGAVIYSSRIDRVMRELGDDKVFASGYTYSGHPVCCAAALKNIEIMEREGLMERAREAGAYFGERLRTLEDLEMVAHVRGEGLMRGLEFVKDKATRALFPEELNIGKVVANACDELGLMVRPIVHLNIMSPPLVITRDEIDFVVATLRKGIAKVTADLKRDGHL